MKKDSKVYIRNILDKAKDIVLFSDGKNLDIFLEDKILQSAILMKLVVIGEEAKKLPADVLVQINLPWRAIKGFRDVAIHDYFDMSMAEVWETTQKDIPEMITEIEVFLAK